MIILYTLSLYVDNIPYGMYFFVLILTMGVWALVCYDARNQGSNFHGKRQMTIWTPIMFVLVVIDPLISSLIAVLALLWHRDKNHTTSDCYPFWRRAS